MNKNFPSSEYALLKRLEPLLNYKKSKKYPLGMGDDAAIRTCKAGEQLVFTADSFVENVHFSTKYMNFREIGFKAMAINLSDCAAMGTLPDGALVQIIFPGHINGKTVSQSILDIYKGLNEACKTWNFPVIGGNLSRGPCWIIDITCAGSADINSRLIRRKGVKSGDSLWVTGFPGSSAAGLAAIGKYGRIEKIPRKYMNLVKSHIRPIPRIEAGIKLARNQAVHAMIDISDGIAKECHTLAFENKTGIILEPHEDCFLPDMRELSGETGKDYMDWFLYGGEDYELLFAASGTFFPACLPQGISVKKIGIFTDRVKEVFFRNKDGKMIKVEKSGWDHLEPCRPG